VERGLTDARAGEATSRALASLANSGKEIFRTKKDVVDARESRVPS
jgi:hypothetical protein